MPRPNKNIPALLKALKKTYPEASCALRHENELELLMATILSAQCTDKRVNMVTEGLFKKYRTAADFSKAPLPELQTAIKSTGFYRSKAKSLKGAGRMIADKFGGRVPDRMEDLIQLPGVARKTANVVLGTAYGKAEGVVVDTHVMRLSERLGLSLEKTPEKIEQDLMKKVPREDWIWLAHALITHGRQVCTARSPRCPACPLRRECANPVFP